MIAGTVYADSIGDWVSCMHRGLSGVCRSRLSYSGIHKHLLKRSARAAELDTIRDDGKRTSQPEESDVQRDVDLTDANKQAKKKKMAEVVISKCVSYTFSKHIQELRCNHNFGILHAAVLFPFFFCFCFNRGEMLKTRLATLNLCED